MEAVPMPSVRLDDRTVIDVAGPDAAHFLQNVLTTDLDALADGEARPGALLSPQGKILFDFLISRNGPDGFAIDCRADAADTFAKRLMLYRLRAKADISKREQPLVTALWHDESSPSQDDSTTPALRDTRFGDTEVFRRYGGNPTPSSSPSDWTLLRIRHGVAEGGSDYLLGDAFPHDVLLDQNGGVGFRKGCYIGQEVVSRMQHRGTARRRVLIASADGPLPATGTEMRSADKPLGTLGSVIGREGLAIARIDKVKQAMDNGEPILAADVPVSLAIPRWAAFRFPEEAFTEGA